MICTVTLNPSLDYFARLDRLTPGALGRTHGEALRPGGKGVNVALTLHRFGLPVTALGFTAGRTGELFTALLDEAGLPNRFFPLPEGMTRINVKIRAREESELNGAGPPVPPAAFAALLDEVDALAPGDWLALSGALPPLSPADAYARLLARARSRGVRAVVDAAGAALQSVLPLSPALVKPNRDELAALLGRAVQGPQDAAAGAAELRAAGARSVLVSLDAEGAVFLPEGGPALYLPAPAGDADGTVGAGDAMAAGFLFAQSQGLAADETLRCAVAAGSAAAFAGHPPDKAAFEAALSRTARPEPLP